MKELTRWICPDASEKELSWISAGEFIAQLAYWDEHVQLFAVMEQANQIEAYEKPKGMAKSIERSRKVARAARTWLYSRGHSEYGTSSESGNHAESNQNSATHAKKNQNRPLSQ